MVIKKPQIDPQSYHNTPAVLRQDPDKMEHEIQTQASAPSQNVVSNGSGSGMGYTTSSATPPGMQDTSLVTTDQNVHNHDTQNKEDLKQHAEVLVKELDHETEMMKKSRGEEPKPPKNTTGGKNSKRSMYGGIAALFVLGALVVGSFVGVRLVQQNQENRSQAANGVAYYCRMSRSELNQQPWKVCNDVVGGFLGVLGRVEIGPAVNLNGATEPNPVDTRCTVVQWDGTTSGDVYVKYSADEYNYCIYEPENDHCQINGQRMPLNSAGENALKTQFDQKCVPVTPTPTPTLTPTPTKTPTPTIPVQCNERCTSETVSSWTECTVCANASTNACLQREVQCRQRAVAYVGINQSQYPAPITSTTNTDRIKWFNWGAAQTRLSCGTACGLGHLCCESPITPTPTQTPTPTPTPTPTVTPPPGALACTGITPVNPVIALGTSKEFTCAGTFPASASVKFAKFQFKVDGGSYIDFGTPADNVYKATMTARDPGSYVVRCQVCGGTSVAAATCTSWQEPTP